MSFALVVGVPDLELETASINFGEVYIGATKTDSIAVSNTGTDILLISNIISGAQEFIVSSYPDTLNSNESGNIIVEF